MKSARHLVIGIIILSLTLQMQVESHDETKVKDIDFHSLLKENYSMLISENRPVIPYYTRTYILPAGSRFSIDVEARGIKNLGRLDM
ncbi:MAG: hypothetical protein J7L31_07545, partial [Thermoplasmata archaeon]|nr:hypothetical protein [Thermoplasmata archaeon]